MQNSLPPRELPLLGGIAAFIRWIEELVNLAAGPLLTIGLGISLVDLLTDGALISSQPFLLYAWAISQAVGVDAQLVASFDRARQALRARHYWSLLGLLLLGSVLVYVAWVSAQVFATQQANHLTTAQALQLLGMSQTAWLVQRSILSVFLVALSGWTRYHPPAKVALTLEDELSAIDRQTKIAEAKQRLREQQAMGAARMGRHLVAAIRGDTEAQEALPKNEPSEAVETRPEKPPTGPGTPLAFPISSQTDDDEDEPGALEANEALLSISQPAASVAVPSKRHEVRKSVTVEGRKTAAYKLLRANPDLSAAALQRQLGCRWETANALKRQFARDQQNEQRRVQ